MISKRDIAHCRVLQSPPRTQCRRLRSRSPRPRSRTRSPHDWTALEARPSLRRRALRRPGADADARGAGDAHHHAQRRTDVARTASASERRADHPARRHGRGAGPRRVEAAGLGLDHLPGLERASRHPQRRHRPGHVPRRQLEDDGDAACAGEVSSARSRLRL